MKQERAADEKEQRGRGIYGVLSRRRPGGGGTSVLRRRERAVHDAVPVRREQQPGGSWPEVPGRESVDVLLL